ncbi:MAG: amino acid ABC transporter substrate-binding protein [Labilithrix sp.]|nr:amino acid ABC transporter substrate-binding protein [Labilithrix sp.]
MAKPSPSPSSAPLKIGYSISLSGPLGANGQSARLAHEIWEEDVNRRGGLLGRRVQMVAIDDQTNASLVPGIYARLLDVDKVDLIIGGYGTNTLLPAMPIVMERRRFFVGLMGLGVNSQLDYPNYFVMIPTGQNPNAALTEGVFELAAAQQPRPQTVALLAADAEFAKNPVLGGQENARRYGLHIVAEELYPLSTEDFAPIIRKLEALAPDVLFICSYLDDSIGVVRAITGRGYAPRLVGGSMIGPQSAVVKTTLGPLLNGFVNYEYWLPVPKMMFDGAREFMTAYQSRALKEGVDALGYYTAPMAYAQMQVVEQAITATGGLEDEKLAEYTRRKTFKTVVGDVAFGRHGEWAESRVLQVQFQNVSGHGVEQFKDPRTQVVVAPSDWASGELIYPYAKAR